MNCKFCGEHCFKSREDGIYAVRPDRTIWMCQNHPHVVKHYVLRTWWHNTIIVWRRREEVYLANFNEETKHFQLEKILNSFLYLDDPAISCPLDTLVIVRLPTASTFCPENLDKKLPLLLKFL